MAPTITEFQRPTVWVRKNWENPWVEAVNELGEKLLDAVGSTDTGGPGIGTAVFRWLYGDRTNEGNPNFYIATPFAYLGWYVQIRAVENEKIVELWTGKFVADRLNIEGAANNIAKGRQMYEAVDLAFLLDRMTVRNAKAIQGGRVVQIDRVPQMNKSTDRGYSGIGNRSIVFDEDGIFRYSRDAAVWTHRQFLEMLLWDNRPAGIRYVLTGQDSLLDSLASSGRIAGLSLRMLLDSLISRHRGLVWGVGNVGFDRGGVVPIEVETIYEEEITVGNVTLSPNNNIIELELGDSHEIELLQFDLVEVNSFDTVEVRGDFVLSCFTINSDVFEKAWTDTKEGYYKDGAKNTDRYEELDEDEQIALNDGYRGQPRFDQVYRQWVMLDNWNWDIEDVNVNPKTDTEGGLAGSGEGGGLWTVNMKRQIMRTSGECSRVICR